MKLVKLKQMPSDASVARFVGLKVALVGHGCHYPLLLLEIKWKKKEKTENGDKGEKQQAWFSLAEAVIKSSEPGKNTHSPKANVSPNSRGARPQKIPEKKEKGQQHSCPF